MKKTITQNKKPLPKEREENQDIETLARLWLEHSREPQNDARWNTLATHINLFLVRFNPNGKSTGLLAGYDADIRQDALCLLLLEGFLEQNPELSKARLTGDINAVGNQLARSIQAASKFARLRMIRELEAFHKHVISIEDIEDLDARGPSHPAYETDLWKLPEQARTHLMLAALKAAEREKLLPSRSVRIALKMLRENWSQARMARHLKVTPQAISQILRRITPRIRHHIEKSDFPIDLPFNDLGSP